MREWIEKRCHLSNYYDLFCMKFDVYAFFHVIITKDGMKNKSLLVIHSFTHLKMQGWIVGAMKHLNKHLTFKWLLNSL